MIFINFIKIITQLISLTKINLHLDSLISNKNGRFTNDITFHFVLYFVIVDNFLEKRKTTTKNL